MATELTFSLQVGAVGAPGASDEQMYRDAIEDAKLGQSLGFKAAWVIEHHFTDYFPTPSPITLLSYIAAACPGLDLGTCVLVLPWYNPLRLAEDLAMLQALSGANLHIGMGRGVAKLEYDAFGVNMSEARERFREAYEIIKLALSGEPFEYKGQYLSVDRTVTARPRLTEKKPNFYGAIGSASSAEIMADIGLPPIGIGQFPGKVLAAIQDNWNKRTLEIGGSIDVVRPILLQCYIGDTDEQAKADAVRYLPSYFKTQVEHYQGDMTAWEDIAGYEQFARTFANLKKLADADNLDGFLGFNIVGSPETVERRIREFMDIGFNHLIVTNSTPGVPKEVRHRMLKRFSAEIMPRFEAEMAEPA
jgi:alkanesulfonate monooxygenase SsuD/methylene tetrahydromethanopterin reductase-like flavin-dependent oxidoreductase (luciferase family)